MSLTLTHYDPQDGHPDEWIADKADASVTTYCIAHLAYFTGNDEAGDAAISALDIACGQDGFSADQVETVKDYLDANYTCPSQWLLAVTGEVNAIERQKARDAAKRAVIAFIAGLWGDSMDALVAAVERRAAA